MENKENLVTEVTENVEQPTEQVAPKLYSEEEFQAKLKESMDKAIPARLARKEAKIRKELGQEYGELMDVLKAGTGKESVADVTNTFRDFYSQKGIQMSQKPNYSAKDIEVLARAEAQDIIDAGYDEVVEEVDRLMKKGAANLTPREKEQFRHLAAYRQNHERGMELSKMGVAKDVYESAEFKEFSDKFNPTTPVKEIWDIYQATKPKKEVKPMGSMKTNTMDDKGVKDFYTRDEAMKFTKKDLDANPALYKAIVNSMLKW